MKRITMGLAVMVLAAAVLAVGSWSSGQVQPTTAPATMAASAPAGEAAVMAGLPKPRMTGGMPLMEALKKRQTARQFADRPLSDQVLSDLLWAAWGVNRDNGKRTAPSAMNWQETDIYVVRADGAWLFDAKANDLQRVTGEDLRGLAGGQPFVKTAPINLVFVADLAKTGSRGSDADKLPMVYADAGFISQNVYLFCASEGLSTVVRASGDKAGVAKALNLRDTQRVILFQTVGYPPAK